MKENPRKKVSPPPPTGPPSADEVARRAYEIYLARGGEPGHEREDWLRAERELREQAASAKKTGRARGQSGG
ncbi:MAG TPA: DUF2934 domain-containing protein [Vicinamibacteria bacterium]|jgi:hypothetical protein|nr:DUF2934 domain-containing protein [Vicinamibacteria bacterium]